MSCSPPRKARKRLIIHSVKRKKEEELLGLDWLQLVGTSNTTTRNIPDEQVLRYILFFMCFPINVNACSCTFHFHNSSNPNRVIYAATSYLFSVRVLGLRFSCLGF